MNALSPIEDQDTAQILTLAQRLVEARRKGRDADARKALKKLLVLVWGGIPEQSRITFVACLDMQGDYGFVAIPDLSDAVKRDSELVKMLSGWKLVVDDPNLSGTERMFALDVLRKSRGRDWKPTEKQERFMRSLWDGANRRAREAAIPDQDLVEDDG